MLSAQGIHNIIAIAPWRASPSPSFARTLRIPTAVHPHNNALPVLDSASESDHGNDSIWLTTLILSLPSSVLILVTVFCGVCVALLPEKVVQ